MVISNRSQEVLNLKYPLLLHHHHSLPPKLDPERILYEEIHCDANLLDAKEHAASLPSRRITEIRAARLRSKFWCDVISSHTSTANSARERLPLSIQE